MTKVSQSRQSIFHCFNVKGLPTFPPRIQKRRDGWMCFRNGGIGLETQLKIEFPYRRANSTRLQSTSCEIGIHSFWACRIFHPRIIQFDYNDESVCACGRRLASAYRSTGTLDRNDFRLPACSFARSLVPCATRGSARLLTAAACLVPCPQ